MPEKEAEPAETPAVEQARLTEDVADAQGTHTEPAKPEVTVQAAKPGTKAGYSYAVGDTVYLDNTAFRIEHIAFFNVQLLDLSAAYPISRVENKHRFENLLLNDERNARFLPREDRKEETAKTESREIEPSIDITPEVTEPKTNKPDEAAPQEQPAPRFDSVEFENLLPHEMRFKETDLVNGNEMFWVTQEPFTIEQLRQFQQAVRDYAGDIRKFYVTPRDLSDYNFEDDMARGVLAVVTPDAILKDDYVRAMRREGLGNYLEPKTVTVLTTPSEKANANDYVIDEEEFAKAARTDSARYVRTLTAVRTLKQIESEGRLATPKEQELLAGYSGWGGLSWIFEKGTYNQREVQKLLTEEEYAAAEASTLTSFYTPPFVISTIYKVLGRMGFTGGNILEPSCGTGNFIGMLPETMRKSRVTAVEIDSVAARIAGQLYQSQTVINAGYENTNLPDNYYDIAVGNVPFGNYKVYDRDYDRHNLLIHDYFLVKTLDKLRPGGVMAILTSTGTMDKENNNARKLMASRADLLGAIRLPDGTFREVAGTDAGADILFLQKRDGIAKEEPEWVNVSENENGFKVNSYFVSHPEMILGKLTKVSGRFGPRLACVSREDEAGLKNSLLTAALNIRGSLEERDEEDPFDIENENNESIPADDESVGNYSFTVKDGKVYYRENARLTAVNKPAATLARIKGMIPVRDAMRDLIDIQLTSVSDEALVDAQMRLNKAYDDFTAKYGLISDRVNSQAFSDDVSYPLISGLEETDENGKLTRKADIFNKRTIRPRMVVTHADTASDALAITLSEKGFVDMDYMSRLTGKSEDELAADLKGVIFLNSEKEFDAAEKTYVTADEYLSGNVRQKLVRARKALKTDGRYEECVAALQEAQPRELEAEEISVRLGATWIKPEYVTQFIRELLDIGPDSWYYDRIGATYDGYLSKWTVEGKKSAGWNFKARSVYGTDRINAFDIIEDTLNLRTVNIYDDVYDKGYSGEKRRVLNEKETAAAQEKQDLIKDAFSEWIFKDEARKADIVTTYNEKFNSIRPREYDGSHLTFPGMNPQVELMPHQKNAVARILYGGNTLLAHAVGAGKTFEMAAAAQESKRMGLCSKAMFVVPNHLTEQWGAEYQRLYPAAKVLVATKKDFEKRNRKKLCGKIATGDWDAVIIGHTQFTKLPMSTEWKSKHIANQVAEAREALMSAKKDGNRRSVKDLNRTLLSLRAKQQKLLDEAYKDDAVTFEQLGVDMLFIDESHYFKNLYMYSKMQNVAGIQQTEAQKSSDLFMKCDYLNSKNPGRGVVFATGTPISNSMVELYTIQRYLQSDTLKAMNLYSFDAWASTFGETVTDIELKPEGNGFRPKTRFARYCNRQELLSLFRQVADVKTAEMLNLPTPKVNMHVISVKPSEIQTELVKELGKRADAVRNRQVSATVDNMLKITNDGRKLALDQRLINPLYPDFEGSKLNACVDQMYEAWEKGREKRTTLLFFCDLATPHGAGFDVYTDIKQKLVTRGVPAEEIKFIHDAKNEAQKEELFGKVRKGEVRILMGSTQKMGAGTNVQDKVSASFDLDCPWRPSDLEQRLGRSVRQGNQNDEVDIYRFVTEGTFDAYLYQLVEKKQRFISQILTDENPARIVEDVDEAALSYAEIKMLATGNPIIKEKMDLEVQVERLKLLKSSHTSEHIRLQKQVTRELPAKISALNQKIAAQTKDTETVKNHPRGAGETFPGMKIAGTFYKDRKEADEAIKAAMEGLRLTETRPLGQYRGFELEIAYAFPEKTAQFPTPAVSVRGAATVKAYLGKGANNIVRIDNAIDAIPNGLEETKQQLSEAKQALEGAKIAVTKPFAREEELKEKSARLEKINATLEIDKPVNAIIDDGPAEDEPARRKSHDMEL